MIEQLQQLCSLTWDGNLISKSARMDLVNTGMARRMPHGYNLITEKGVRTLAELNLIPKKSKP